ncbi:hypothetical protein FIBSPDRAFT_1036414 [Athelia psychrophila]|uniref:Uncharacterized protein n=1 Tax=Athelia psychrophila TaxID=1759441 RepID=A0A166W2R0_9AGAM|nr:hypothetical protein FIBSPDRAFT_1036414 [Fibularhizoctonia sp. CBS 109695]
MESLHVRSVLSKALQLPLIDIVNAATLNRRGQIIVSPKSPKTPLSDQTPVNGAYLRMHPVHIPATMDDKSVWLASSSFERITALDHENFRCAWVNEALPKWLLYTERWQTLTTVHRDGKDVTRYESLLVFWGVLAYLVNVLMGSGLKKSSQAMGEALKKRAEDAV